jgi:hypothetical protein
MASVTNPGAPRSFTEAGSLTALFAESGLTLAPNLLRGSLWSAIILSKDCQ